MLREVAVLDKINPGGLYSSRVRRLSQFVDARRWAEPVLSPKLYPPLYEGARARNKVSHDAVSERLYPHAAQGMQTLDLYYMVLRRSCADSYPDNCWWRLKAEA